jgi:serine/threonine-protein kinase RsbT
MLGPLSLPATARWQADGARQQARQFCQLLDLAPYDAEAVVLAVSELAMNLARYAEQGEIVLSRVDAPRGVGVQIVSRDQGPGIPDLARALEDGYSTGGGLGSGLPGVRRLMDDFAIESRPAGTRIVATKWLSRP